MIRDRLTSVTERSDVNSPRAATVRGAPQIFVDADGCPVKDEVLRVARRYEMRVTLVANSWMNVPDDELVTLEVVGRRFDAADDWIAQQAAKNDVVISADIPLAARCIEAGARVLDPRGRELTDETIGEALATRELMSHLRELGINVGGPAPMQKKDRSRFLQRMDAMVQAVRRASRASG